MCKQCLVPSPPQPRRLEASGRRCRGPSLEHIHIRHPRPPRRTVLRCFSLHATEVQPACPTTCHQPSWGLSCSQCLLHRLRIRTRFVHGTLFPEKTSVSIAPLLLISTPKVSELHVPIYALPVSLSPYYASSSASPPVPHRAKSRPALVMGTSATSTELGARGTFWGCGTVG